jgi:2-methylcitrate dehydratase PrpD
VRVPDDFKAHRGQWGDGVNWGEMRLTVRLKDGRRLTMARSHARGWPEMPASWDDIAEKFHECCAGVLPAAQAAEALACIQRLDAADARDLIGTLRVT